VRKPQIANLVERDRAIAIGGAKGIRLESCVLVEDEEQMNGIVDPLRNGNLDLRLTGACAARRAVCIRDIERIRPVSAVRVINRAVDFAVRETEKRVIYKKRSGFGPPIFRPALFPENEDIFVIIDGNGRLVARSYL